MVASGTVVGTGFTDQIQSNKHKVFTFDMPSARDVIIRITYKDYGSATGITTLEEPVTLTTADIKSGGGDTTAVVIPIAVVVLVLIWYLRKRGKNKVKIDVSKYK